MSRSNYSFFYALDFSLCFLWIYTDFYFYRMQQRDITDLQPVKRIPGQTPHDDHTQYQGLGMDLLDLPAGMVPWQLNQQ